MLTKSEFMEGIRILQNNYQKTYTTEQLKLFYESLKDMKKDKFIKNIKLHIKSSVYMPNIAEIRNEIKKETTYSQRDYSNVDFNKFYENI